MRNRTRQQKMKTTASRKSLEAERDGKCERDADKLSMGSSRSLSIFRVCGGGEEDADNGNTSKPRACSGGKYASLTEPTNKQTNTESTRRPAFQSLVAAMSGQSSRAPFACVRACVRAFEIVRAHSSAACFTKGEKGRRKERSERFGITRPCW